MLYLGHFSFDSTEPTTGKRSRAWHGYFTCVVEADDVNVALERFKRLILELRKTSDLFQDSEGVGLEACVEIRSVLRHGFLAFYNLLEGEDQGGVSTAIRGANERQAVAFRAHVPGDEGSEDELEAEPFVTFRPARRLAPAKSTRHLKARLATLLP